MFEIKDNFEETPSIKTVRLDGHIEAIPGQFVMVWVPGVDEYPMSVSYVGDRFGITYQVVGEGTKALAEMKPGQKIGIRGPYGKGFTISGKRLLLVAGGAGMAPLASLVDIAIARRGKVDLVLGARTKNEILFDKRASKAGAKVHLSTDDGSKGFKGFVTELAKEVLAGTAFDSMYACGPEKMIVRLLQISRAAHVPMQASLERIMKCGIGICDSCALDGKHVCTDGPVFHDSELITLTDLGKTKLDFAGRKTPV